MVKRGLKTEDWGTEREWQIIRSLADTHSVKTTASNLRISRRRIYNVLIAFRRKILLSQNTINHKNNIRDPYVKKLLIPIVRKEEPVFDQDTSEAN